MSTNQEDINYWSEVDAGFRGSLMLRLGALVTAAGALVNLGAQVLAGNGDPSSGVTIVAWLLYILGLWGLAAGFFWVGAHAFLTRFGFVVGTLHAVQGIQLLVILFTFTQLSIPPISLTVGRLLSIIIFAIIEKEWLSNRTRLMLGGSAGLLLIKATGRVLDYWPELGNPVEPLFDAVLLLALTVGMLQLSNSIHLQENDWAETAYNMGHSDFADFNNPEHTWNKNKNNGKSGHK